MLANQKGAIQSTFVIVASIITLGLLAVAIVVFVTRQIDNREQDKRLSQEVAEYGLTEALEQIKNLPAWTEGYRNVKYREGIYSVAIEKTTDSIYKAIATGINNSAKTIIVCTYKLEKIDSLLKPKTLSWEYQ